ncbi:carcinoembryonic antigen-related cell adhesion molecule 21-like [Protopterus annectens]|uniref:carcinoembryonic antigen-related cell adhesion molecule 21-like n=1 Tax=Protopterus annectens TaxID=7888 RepID=UPI001CF9DCFB|nr:carcinoembryonic antigen-related cell adhesion molecule 21-like [Protopterus annectens]
MLLKKISFLVLGILGACTGLTEELQILLQPEINSDAGSSVHFLVTLKLNTNDSIFKTVWFYRDTPSTRWIHLVHFLPGQLTMNTDTKFRTRMEFFTENQTLFIRDLQLQDSGFYKITVDTHQGENQEKETYLKIYESLLEPVITESNVIQLNCSAKQAEVSVYWTKAGIKLQGASQQYHLLTIPAVANEDHDTYKCIAENLSGKKAEVQRASVSEISNVYRQSAHFEGTDSNQVAFTAAIFIGGLLLGILLASLGAVLYTKTRKVNHAATGNAGDLYVPMGSVKHASINDENPYMLNPM